MPPSFRRACAVALLLAGLASAAAAAPPSKPDSVAISQALVQSGERESAAGEFADAVARLSDAVGILERNLPHADLRLAHARIQLSVPLAELGQYGPARELIDESLSRIETRVPPDSVELGNGLNAEGRLLSLMGNSEGARPVLERALAVRQASLAGDDSRIALTLNNLANVYSDLGDLKASLPVYRRLITLEEARQQPDSTHLAMYLNNCANATSDLGNLTEGRQLYERALMIRERVFGPTSPRLVSTLIGLASVEELERNFPAALADLQRGGDIADATLGPGHPQTAEMLIDRSTVEWRMGRFDTAFDDAYEGGDRTTRHLKRTAQWIASSDALRYEESRISGLGLLMQIVAARPSQDPEHRRRAYDALVRSRAVLLDEFANRTRFLSETKDTSLARLSEAWTETSQKFATLSLTGLVAASRDSSYRREKEAAEGAALAAETDLARRSAALRARSEEDHIGLADVVRALPPGSAMLSIVRYDAVDSVVSPRGRPRYLAFLLRAAESVPTAVDLGDAPSLDSLLTGWRRALVSPRAHTSDAEPERAYRRIAGALRTRVWDRVAPDLANVNLVFFVPDGAFHGFSFATLPEGTGYLVERGPLFQDLSTERDVVRQQAGREQGEGILVVGGVDFDHSQHASTPQASAAVTPFLANRLRASSPCLDMERGRFERLPGTETEARDIAALWSRYRARPGESPRLLSGPSACKQEFERLAPGFGTIHVATHGFAFDPNCLGASAAESSRSSRPEEFLLRCGLALAGANQPDSARDSSEGGMLTAAEIAAMDLHHARFVVLSACGSGLGSITQQEGVFGLQRAFQLAGAGTIVMSLWNVGDQDTRVWMEALYRARLRDRLSAPAATAAASRSLLRALRVAGASTLPTRWGAFISAGDWR